MIHTLDLHFCDTSQTIASFLIPTSEGPILVETGPQSTFNQLSNQVEEVGFSIEQVKHVFLTHIHLDHGGGAWELARLGATIHLHPQGIPHFADPSKLMSSVRRIYGDQTKVLWGDLEPIPVEQMIPIDHMEKVKVGAVTLKALHTPGHAIHHIAWQYEDVLFTGDIGGVKIGSGPVVPPCPPPDINLEDWMDSIDLILEQHPSALYLSHFGRIDSVEDHLEQLRKSIWDWANWIRPRWEDGGDMDRLTLEFQEYTRKQLAHLGVSNDLQEKYEIANPTWMSVAGLVRYWSKK